MDFRCLRRMGRRCSKRHADTNLLFARIRSHFNQYVSFRTERKFGEEPACLHAASMLSEESRFLGGFRRLGMTKSNAQHSESSVSTDRITRKRYATLRDSISCRDGLDYFRSCNCDGARVCARWR